MLNEFNYFMSAYKKKKKSILNSMRSYISIQINTSALLLVPHPEFGVEIAVYIKDLKTEKFVNQIRTR